MPKEHLSDQSIKNLKVGERTEYHDQHLIENGELKKKGAKGLLLRVTPAGGKYFYFSYWYGGKSKKCKIGDYPDVSLADARATARELADQVNDGIDPAREKRRKKQTDPKRWGK